MYMFIMNPLFGVLALLHLCDGVLLNDNINGNSNSDSISHLRQDVLSLIANQNARIKALEERVEHQTKESADGSVAFMTELGQSVLASGIGYIGYDNIITNVGGAFTTPHFIVPTNSTYYLRFQTMSIPQTTSTKLKVKLMKNGTAVEGTVISPSALGNTTVINLSGHFLLSLAQNDVIRVDITECTGRSYIIGGDLSTHFMGFKIH